MNFNISGPKGRPDFYSGIDKIRAGIGVPVSGMDYFNSFIISRVDSFLKQFVFPEIMDKDFFHLYKFG
jgi:hypothetical protein